MQSVKTNYRAGILPYAIINYQLFFLLGKDRVGKEWSDFGGNKIDDDGDNPFTTATRKLAEETANTVYVTNKPTIVIKTNDNVPYYLYLIHINLVDYNTIFLNKLRKDNTDITNEQHLQLYRKVKLDWLSVHQVMNTINLTLPFENLVHKHGTEIIKAIEEEFAS